MTSITACIYVLWDSHSQFCVYTQTQTHNGFLCVLQWVLYIVHCYMYDVNHWKQTTAYKMDKFYNILWILLYSIGKYTQYPVINHNGKEYEKEYIYICLNHFAIYQKVAQQYKSIIFQLKRTTQIKNGDKL